MRSTRILISKSYVCNWHVKSENSRVRRFEKLKTWKLNNLKVIEIRERLEIDEDENSREPRPRRVWINAYCPFCFTCSSKMPARLIDHFRLIFSLVLPDVFNIYFVVHLYPDPRAVDFVRYFAVFLRVSWKIFLLFHPYSFSLSRDAHSSCQLIVPDDAYLAPLLTGKLTHLYLRVSLSFFFWSRQRTNYEYDHECVFRGHLSICRDTHVWTDIDPDLWTSYLGTYCKRAISEAIWRSMDQVRLTLCSVTWKIRRGIVASIDSWNVLLGSIIVL